VALAERNNQFKCGDCVVKFFSKFLVSQTPKVERILSIFQKSKEETIRNKSSHDFPKAQLLHKKNISTNFCRSLFYEKEKKNKRRTVGAD